MGEPKRTELSVRQENALLVGAILPGEPPESKPLEELESLARTAGARVVGTMRQRLKRIDPAYYIGRGKAEQIRLKSAALGADVVIFDNDLSPAQIRDLEEVIDRKVLDRSELILDIFATRARTHQARLAVELAQLEYTFPRLRRMWTHLDTIVGGAATGIAAVGGIGTRGPGETQIETDRRIVRRRLAMLRERLAEIERRRDREVASRRDQFLVSLVGYTNAGKSSLMNALTGSKVFVEDKLFATLDTKTVQWKLAPGRVALLSDTVGFVRDLPHHLIESFKATLAEATHADLLLHVVDVANPAALQQVETVEAVLADLGVALPSTEPRAEARGQSAIGTEHLQAEAPGRGAANRPNLLLVLNKLDAADDPSMLQVLLDRCPQAVAVSARTGRGLDVLAQRVLAAMQGTLRRITVTVPLGEGKALNYIEAHAEQIFARSYDDTCARIDLAISDRWMIDLRRFNGAVQIESAG